MLSGTGPTVAIVDYGMGNLFSVSHALKHVGIPAVITSSKEEILGAGAVLLPGVGAFGDAMAALRRLDLVEPLREIAASEKMIFGICLGMQLFMTESYEFGTHRGLDVFTGAVVPFSAGALGHSRVKVPHVGWTRIFKKGTSEAEERGSRESDGRWQGSPLRGLRDGEYLYFVHSYYAVPEDPAYVTSTSGYGDVEFCSSLWRRNVFGCQFHPERSGPQGLRIYRNLASIIEHAGVRES